MWLGRLASRADGFMMVGDTAFYAGSEAPSSIPDGVESIAISSASIRDFVAAYDLSLFNPMLLGGLFIGAMMAFLFCAMSMKAVGRAASKMVDEVRRQFREIAGIMEGTAKPDYARCVEISTRGAQHEMVLPSLLAIIVPVAVGIVMGVLASSVFSVVVSPPASPSPSCSITRAEHGITPRSISRRATTEARVASAIRLP